MRRLDRKTDDVLGILQKCKVLRLGLCANNTPYVVPLNFGYTLENGALTFYLHCANAGKKLDLIRQNPNVCVELDCSHELVRGESACSCTFYYESLIAFGQAELVEAFEEKAYALHKLMEHQCGQGTYEFPQKAVDGLTVIKVTCKEYTAKAHTKEA